MRLQNPNVPDWTIEVTDKELIKAHLEAGWQEMATKRKSVKKASAPKTQETEHNESSPDN
jgi:hypothetical protein